MALHPSFPIVEGEHRMTEEWGIYLPDRFNRRFEAGNLVLWRPKLTFWIAVWGNDKNEQTDDRLAWILREASAQRRNEKIERDEGVVWLTYELPEEDAKRSPRAYTSIAGYVLSDQGHVQISAYCDDAPSLKLGYEIIRSVQPTS